MMRNPPHPIDRHVGLRLRLRRHLMGMSQEALAKALGLTFQQVQKYERGTNRISCSRLYDVSQVLDVPVAFFFDGIEPDPVTSKKAPKSVSAGSGATGTDWPGSKEAVDLVRAFSDIGDTSIRQAIVELVKAASKAKGPSSPSR